MDLGTFSDAYTKANEDGRELRIMNPNTGDPIGLTLVIAGPYSKRQADAGRDLTDFLAERRNLSEDERAAAIRRRFARGVISWKWEKDLTFRGSVPECTLANVDKVFEEVGFVYDQVVGETNNPRGFTVP